MTRGMGQRVEDRPRNAVIVGASSGVGRALAETLAGRGCPQVIAARGGRDLEAVASDLRLRWGALVHTCAVDLGEPSLDAAAFRSECQRRLGEIDDFILTAAQIDPADEGPADPELSTRLINVNYANAVRLISEFATAFERRGSGTIVVFSSIAAAAPRRRNTLYSSTKAGLETYCSGLRHYFAGSAVQVNVIALGYADTSMSFGQKLLFPVAAPRDVAGFTVRTLGRDVGLVYYPRFWRLVVAILRWMPWFIYRNLRF